MPQGRRINGRACQTNKTDKSESWTNHKIPARSFATLLVVNSSSGHGTGPCQVIHTFSRVVPCLSITAVSWCCSHNMYFPGEDSEAEGREEMLGVLSVQEAERTVMEPASGGFACSPPFHMAPVAMQACLSSPNFSP